MTRRVLATITAKTTMAVALILGFTAAATLTARPAQAQYCGSGNVVVTTCPIAGTVGTSTSGSVTFTIQNNDFLFHYYSSVVAHCNGTYFSSCSTNVSSLFLSGGGLTGTVTLNYTTTGTPAAWSSSPYVELIETGGASTIDAYFNATHPSSISVAATYVQGGYLNPALCVVNCFDATYAQSTVPYYTLDTPRNVTLVYRGDRDHPRPILYADVTLASGGGNATGFTLKAQVNGTYVTFASSGTTSLSFSGATAGTTVRLSGQFDAASYATGVYPVTLEVTGTYAGGNVTQTASASIAIVSSNMFQIAKGWGIAGLARVVTASPSTGYLVIDGSGERIWFTGLGVMAADYSILTGDDTTYTRTFPDGTRQIFGHDSRIHRLVDRLGRTTTFQYNVGYQLQYIFDPGYQTSTTSRYVQLYYDSNGLSSMVERGGAAGFRTTSVTVNASNQLTRITDPDTYHTDFGYDGSARLSTVTDRLGAVTTYGYNAGWKLSSVAASSVPVDNGSGGTTAQTVTTTFTPWQTAALPSGASGTPVNVTNGVSASLSDPLSHMTSFLVDRYGAVLREVDAAGNSTTIIPYGILPAVIMHPLPGSVDSLVYDSNGSTIASKSSGGSWIYIRYGVYAQPDSIWGVGYRGERRFLSANGTVDSVRYAPASGGTPAVIKYTYDGTTKQVASVTDALGHITRVHYDGTFGNADSTLVAGSRWTKTTFDAYGRPATVAAASQPTRTIRYDTMNRTTRVLDGLAPDSIIFRYNALYRTSAIDRAGHLADSTEYDILGRIAAAHDTYNPALATTYRYDKAGRLTSYTNRRGERVTMQYDALNRLTSRRGTNVTTDTITYAYDWYSKASNANAAVETIHNYATAIDSVVTTLGTNQYSVLTTGYDQFSATNVIKVGSGTLSIAQRSIAANALTGQLSGITIGSATTSFTYDTDGLPTGTTYPGSTVIRTNGYTTIHQLMATSFNATAVDHALHRDEHRDALGRLDALNTVSLAPSQWLFQYDSLGQVTQADSRNTCSAPTLDVNSGYTRVCSTLVTSYPYSYDKAGNRTDLSGTYTSTGNRVTAFNGYLFTHDADGNITRKYTAALTFDTRYRWYSDGKLKEVVNALTGDSVSFRYDALGRLVKRLTNGTADHWWLNDGDQILAELDGSFNKLADYIYTGTDQPFAVTDGSGTLAYYQLDAEGNVIGQHTATGTVSATMTYGTWGGTAVSGTLRGSLLWKGLHYESGGVIGGSGLYYMRARWYDPDLGRFLSEDPIGVDGGLNRYVFAGNDPVNGIDPSGLDPDDECAYFLAVYGYRCLTESHTTGQAPPWPFSTPLTSGFNANASDRGGNQTGATGGGGGTPSTKPQPKPTEKIKKVAKLVLACTLDHYGLNALLTAAGVGGVYTGLGTIPKRFVTEGSSEATSIASTFFRSAVDTRLPFRVLAPTLRRPLAMSAKLGTVFGRWTPIVGWGLLAYDAYRIGSCVADHS